MYFIGLLHGQTYKCLARNKIKQRTSTVNPHDRQSAKLTDQAPGNIDKAAHESSRTTSSSTAIPSQHHADPAGLSPESSQPAQPSARRWRAEPHYCTDTTRTRTRGAPLPGCHHLEELVDSYGRTAGLRGKAGREGRGKGGDEQTGGRAREWGGRAHWWRGDGARAGKGGGGGVRVALSKHV